MKTIKNALKFFLAGMILVSLQARTEDIDLFSGIQPGGGNIPTVLLGWHSSGNANANTVHGCTYNDDGEAPELGDTTGGMEQCAMVNTMLSLIETENEALLGNVKVGLMVFNETGFNDFDNGSGLGNGDNTCGFLMVPPALMNEAGIRSFVSLLKQFEDNDLANQSRLGDLIAESWAALNGLSSSCSGVDYSGLADVATDCRDAVLVYIGNATKETANVSDGTGDPESLLKSQLSSNFSYAMNSQQYQYFTAPRAVTLLNNSGSDSNKYWGDEWTRFMNAVDVDDSAQTDGNVTTYSVAVYDPELADKLAGEINFLADMASEGGGKAFKVTANDHAGLEAVLLQIFNEVQDVNSVFSSATLPVSANTQGTYLNQVYIAMFRPDSTALPRWNGNLKQYQLGFDSGGNIVLTDATQDPNGDVTSVTNPITGSIADSATSFWTTDTPEESNGSAVADWPVDGYWRNSPEGSSFAFDGPDGNLVEKGGVGQMLRIDNLTSSDERTVYTCLAPGLCPSDSTLPELTSDLTGLVDNLSALIGSVVSGSSSSLTVGEKDTGESIRISSCTGNGANTLCEISHDGDMVFSAVYDQLVVEGAWNDSDYLTSNKWICTFDAPCAITASTDSSVTIKGQNISALEGLTFSGTTLVKLSKSAEISQYSHDLNVGDQVKLENCAVINLLGQTTYNTSLFNDDVYGSVSAVANSNSYTLTLSDYVLAETSTGLLSTLSVTCSSSETTLIPSSLIAWIRGDDVAYNETRKGPCPPELLNTDSSSADYCPITVRPSVHGDVLHSRPAVINYGGDDGVVLFYGSNDGHFRAVNGNQEAYIGDVRPGGELWSFVAPEFHSKLIGLYKNSPLVKFPMVTDSSAEERNYYFDGVTTVLQDTRSGSPTENKSFVFLSARRGGKLIYAMDVTDPSAPKFMWRFTDGNLNELGQTWSQPKVAVLSGYDNPVLVFGAGYDEAEDADPAPASSAKGRGIVMLDAVTGEIVWAALPSCSGVTVASGGACRTESGLTRSIAADVTLVDRDYDGYIDRLYAPDVGGNIWRVDLEADGVGTTSPAEFQIGKFASLGGSGNEARKFLFAVDVVLTNRYDAVVAASGDREHPLYTDDDTAGLAYNVQNKFFVLMDRNRGKSMCLNIDGDATACSDTGATRDDPLEIADLIDQTYGLCQDDDGMPVSCDDETASKSFYFDGAYANVQGYYVDFDTGEKGVNAPLVVAGRVYFGTNQPDTPNAGSCTANLGIARAYEINLVTGEYSSTEFSGGGLPPSPIAGLVTIGDGDNEQTVPFIIGGKGPSPFDPSLPDLEIPPERKRSFWFIE